MSHLLKDKLFPAAHSKVLFLWAVQNNSALNNLNANILIVVKGGMYVGCQSSS